MKNWKKLLIGTVAIAAVGLGANMVALAAGSDDPAGVVDISGPCDEAEHANDPECVGVAGSAAAGNQSVGRVDISGPCDEAEHANDPQCTGAVNQDDDNSGPGSHDDDGEMEDNSGPGSHDDDGEMEDNSGPGSHDDDGEGDDESGHEDD